MVYGSVSVKVGDRVNTGTLIGKMGNTGNSTGTHLHLECSTTQNWSCSSFVDPGYDLGIPNVRGTIVQYDGSAEPEPPVNPDDPEEPDDPDQPDINPKRTRARKWLMAKAKKINIKY